MDFSVLVLKLTNVWLIIFDHEPKLIIQDVFAHIAGGKIAQDKNDNKVRPGLVQSCCFMELKANTVLLGFEKLQCPFRSSLVLV